MPKLERLKVRRDFLKVAASRRKWVTERLILQGAPRLGEGESSARVGFTASRKVGNAVARNRAKRRLRALAAELAPELALPGWDYVLIARQTMVTCRFDVLRDDMSTAFIRLARLREKRSSRHKPNRPRTSSEGAVKTGGGGESGLKEGK